MSRKSCLLELQDVVGVAAGEDAAYEVEVAHVDAGVGAARQRHGGEQLALERRPTAAHARDGAVVAVAHHRGDDRGLLGDEEVLAVAFVEDSWRI